MIVSNLLCSGLYYISHLDLRQNPLGNEGIKILAKGIRQSNSLVHLDLRSTAFRKEGADHLFKALEENETVNCLQIGNLKGLHRNMLAGKAVAGIEGYLKKTSVLTFLDLKSAGIGYEGLYYLLKGFRVCSSVKFLNLALNTLETAAHPLILELILKMRLKRLDLSQNMLGNSFLAVFNQTVRDTHFVVAQLSLSCCGFSGAGMSLLFEALKRGVALEDLVIEDAKYDEESLKKLALFISSTSLLKSFSSANCSLGDTGMRVVSGGFAENYSIEAVNFSGNRITDKGVVSLCDNLLRTHSKRLKSINLSHNFIEVIIVVKD
eukprot:TRINITY_DN13824_c0_g1_i2.p1 TRINITY_DN13824_c0_g1~~TRINITY_DN13824_c0_g1_i2.p1  ORF type:complete len:321 (+),score=67.35 TRINITY_DN13824_c0_g1_i2:1090-2052(+)